MGCRGGHYPTPTEVQHLRAGHDLDHATGHTGGEGNRAVTNIDGTIGADGDAEGSDQTFNDGGRAVGIDHDHVAGAGAVFTDNHQLHGVQHAVVQGGLFALAMARGMLLLRNPNDA